MRRCSIREKLFVWPPAIVGIYIRTPARQFDNDLNSTLRLTIFVPPDHGFGRAIPHLRQFLLNLQQAACAHIGSRLLNGAVHALLRIQNVHIS
jgi:hypothetical protein